jgi:wobble nucleotide-excising tRNase
MPQSLKEIAQTLQDANKKVQLIYAFNGSGKTRLSREFRLLVAPKGTEDPAIKILYYNAFTEDLFNWDNDLDADVYRKLTIKPNGFTNLVLEFIQAQGLDGRIISNFQHFTNQFLSPIFSPDLTEVTFSIQRGDNENLDNIKISKGEESNFIWCIFYSLLEQVIEILNTPEVGDRPTDKFDNLEYIFIDDPVSSLDENHLIELAVNLASLIKHSTSNLRFVISTHNITFYNVLYNELALKAGNVLKRYDDGTFEIEEKKGDSNKSFSYHLHIKHVLEVAIKDKQIQKYHFTLLRNLYEKTASFLGYPQWSNLLPGDQKSYLHRIMHFTSHSTLSTDVVPEPTDPEKQIVVHLLNHLITNYNYWKERENVAI